MAADNWANFSAGVFMVALGLWLLYLNVRSKVHVAFALFLFSRGFANAILSVARGPAGNAFLGTLQAAFWIALPFAALYFMMVYRGRYGAIQYRKSIPIYLVLLALVFETILFINPSLWGTARFSPTGGFESFDAGPLRIFFDFRLLFYVGITYFLVRDYVRAEPGPAAKSLALVSLGIALDAVFLVIWDVVDFGYELMGSRALAGAALAGRVVSIISFVLVLMAFVTLWRAARTVPDARVRHGARNYAYALLLPVVTGVLTSIFRHAELSWAPAFGLTVDGIWTFAFPLLVTYALVRHQLFELDVKIKWTIKSGTIAAVFLAVFFVVAQLVQNYFQTNLNWAVGGVAAGLLLFALNPLQHLAERVANTAMPGVKSIRDMSDPEKTNLYEDQVRFAWSDGMIDRSERLMLDNLRRRLGLDAEAAAAIETEYARLGGSSAPTRSGVAKARSKSGRRAS